MSRSEHQRRIAAGEVTWHHSTSYLSPWSVSCHTEHRPGDLRTFDPLAVTCAECIAASPWVQQQRAKAGR